MFIADIPPQQVPVITQAVTTEQTVGRNSESARPQVVGLGILRRMESDETIRRNALRLLRPTRAVLGACQFVEIGNPMGSAINSISVLPPVGDFLKIGPRDSFNGLVKITVLDQPKHGIIQLETDPRAGDTVKNGGPYHYSPDASYYGGKNQYYKGSDQFSFDVEAQGKHFKVIYNVYVVDVVDFVQQGQYPKVNNLCPNPSMSWRISEGGAVTGDESSAMALNDWILSGQLNTFAAVAAGVTLDFTDLAGGALGQTTGSTITLDTTAAGNNWFIDTTPSDNSEYLPTSNPNEWVAKAGSADGTTSHSTKLANNASQFAGYAAGKMDMLSVLLHEYGHALGIDHSADGHDYMGTTLTAGVRRLPTADEMALMQQLIASLLPSPAGRGTEGEGATVATDTSLTLTLSQGAREQGQNPSNVPFLYPRIPVWGSGATLPLGGIAFAGLLQRNRYGGLNAVLNNSTMTHTT